MAIKDLMFWKKKEEFPAIDEGIPDFNEPLPGTDSALPGSDMMPGTDSALPGAEPMPHSGIQTTFQAPGTEPPEEPGIRPRLEPAPLEIKPESVSPKDLEIISAKLDNLRLSFDVLNNKIDNLERLMKDSSKRW